MFFLAVFFDKNSTHISDEFFLIRWRALIVDSIKLVVLFEMERRLRCNRSSEPNMSTKALILETSASAHTLDAPQQNALRQWPRR